MSIRVFEIARRIGKDNKVLLALLKERGHDVKSVSSTISNIYAEALEQEFGLVPEVGAAPAVPASPPAAIPPVAPPVAEHPPAASPQSFVRLPHAGMVKSAQDVADSRAKEAAAKLAASARPAPAAPPTVVRPRIVAGPVSAPPPAPRPAHFAPPPAPPVPGARYPSISAPRPSVPVSSPIPPPPIARSPAPVPPLPPGLGSPKPAPTLAAPGQSALAVTPPAQTATITTEGDIKIIHLKPPVIVRDFAIALGLKPFVLISEMMKMGVYGSVNQTIDEAVAEKIAGARGFLLEIKHRGEAAPQPTAKEKETDRKRKADEDETKNLAPRPPVVCILGHVDHGKTSLLDAIRKASVAAGEAGGITQHIGAYQIVHHDRPITFLDTPGHAAFNKMRARGASVTDIAVLVVAADDGFMPQTDEALEHARAAKVAVIVAVNKMDVKGANLDRVKTQMQERQIAPEDWGGETITVPVSALKGTGLPELLDMIQLQAEMLQLKANPKAAANGVVIESQIDVGRGPLATVIVQRGTLRVGDALVCGPSWCKVRALFDDQGKNVKEAGPATPVRVIGWTGTPDAGSPFRSAKNAREAENLAEAEHQLLRQDAAAATAAIPQDVSVEKLFANIAAERHQALRIIIKADVFGSAEAVRQILDGIVSAKVNLEILSAEVGLVTKNDVLMADSAGAVIVGFNVKLENGVTPLAKHHSVRIESFGIIYELEAKVREMMADLIEPDLKETKTGAAEVRATFPLAKGFVAGCLVTEGKITRNASARLRRKKEILHEGKVGTLKRFKDDANEVRAGLECGIKLDDFNGYEVGDVIECFEVQKVRASL